ncbi:MAG TPA: phosphotransferase [Chloroflexota bacterium]|jgi:hypothetical protein|nr:phosphotransferase [Chloroflexota bacterium]
MRVDRLLVEAEAAVAAFVAGRPEYSVDACQPANRGGTNRVIFGARAGEPGEAVVFKYFVTPQRWRHELACLRHFGHTGLVPRVLECVPPRLLVLSRLPGHDLDLAGLDAAQVGALSREIGAALAVLAGTPLPAQAPGEDGYSVVRDFDPLLWGEDLRAVVARYAAACRGIQRRVPAYRQPFFAGSLDLLEAQVEGLDRQRRVLFHEDIANLRVEGARFRGFYDLEMCRLGTEAMQLGVALGLCGPGGLDWGELVAGYQAGTGTELTPGDMLAALAMEHFYHWTRICWWGRWSGEPGAVERWRAAEDGAAAHGRAMRRACRVVRGGVPVEAWSGPPSASGPPGGG